MIIDEHITDDSERRILQLQRDLEQRKPVLDAALSLLRTASAHRDIYGLAEVETGCLVALLASLEQLGIQVPGGAQLRERLTEKESSHDNTR